MDAKISSEITPLISSEENKNSLNQSYSTISEESNDASGISHAGEGNLISIEQVDCSTSVRNMIKKGYRYNNRFAVTGAIGAGVVGLAIGGLSGGLAGMFLGSSIGGPMGIAFGVTEQLIKQYRSSSITQQSSKNKNAKEGHSFNHVIEVVDHVGHYATVASLATSAVVGIAFLYQGEGFVGALERISVYSGAAWAFGFTIGTATWLLKVACHAENDSTISHGSTEEGTADVV